MVELLEKIDIDRDEARLRLYNTETVQERFKLPARKEEFKSSISSFLYELILLSFFCLRDKRFRQIARIVFKLIKQVKIKPKETPDFLLNAFLELDSTFIKIGQFLSTRSDLLPKEYIEVLSELQDSLPPLPFEKVKSQVEKELRKSLEKIFKSFEVDPIASASIGQVHKAELLNGLNVVVKIQRPDLNILFYHDLAILRCIATFMGRYTEIGKDREWVQIIDEIGKTLFEEIDFIQEGRNADRFRKNLKYEERIYIPKVFWQYTTRKLITIEYVGGIKITDLNSLKQNNLNPEELALVLVNAYFKQFFEDGFYHADPHPGNIVVKNDGTIVFYDFGMVGRINENIRAELATVLFSIIGNDTDTLLSTLKKLELIKQDINIQPIKRVIEQAAYKYYGGAKLSDIDLNGVEDDLKKLFHERPMKLPSKFAYTLRMTGTLEGICRTLDPDFSLVKAATPYFQDWIKEKSPESQKSKWIYLKALFPNQSKLIDRAKIYLEVIRDLPKYVSNIEQNKLNADMLTSSGVSEQKEKPEESTYLKGEIAEVNLKLRFAYTIVFLLCFTFIGSFLVEKGSQVVSMFGFLLLLCSLIGAITIVSWSILGSARIVQTKEK